MIQKKFCQTLLLLFFCFGAACYDKAPPPSSDSLHEYSGGAIPVDDSIYNITGEVVSDVSSLTRQTARAESSAYVAGPAAFGTSFGPQFGGKGFVRLLVSQANPSTELAPVGQIVLIKTSDAKASVLLPGDKVEFRCRAQYEPVAAVRNNETFVADKLATWELDYCRLSKPVIEVVVKPEAETSLPSQ